MSAPRRTTARICYECEQCYSVTHEDEQQGAEYALCPHCQAADPIEPMTGDWSNPDDPFVNILDDPGNLPLEMLCDLSGGGVR